MPFDTIGNSQKRIRSSPLHYEEGDDLYSTSFNDSIQSPFVINTKDKDWLPGNWMHGNKEKLSPTTPSINNNNNSPSVYSLSLPNSGNTSFWQQPTLSMPNTTELDIWSKFHLSYTEAGINMEANVTSVSDLHSLIDVFSKLCSTDSPVVPHDPRYSPSISQSPTFSGDDYISSNQSVTSAGSGLTVCRNKSHKLRPVNYFASVGRLGQLSHPNSKHGLVSLKQVADACIDTYFTCWIRNIPVLRKEEFMTWYQSQAEPTNTLIVNAICLIVFRHMVLHHSIAGIEHFIGDQDKIQEQEEYFFDTARECLSHSFDSPDRFTIISLMFMVFRAEPSRKHHYAGMAVSALHELEIYPRTINESDDESYEKEMDTRLWWFVWAWDFYLHSSGSPKNTPQPKIPGSEIDLPRIIEQDIDEDEISVISHIHCLRLWKMQAHLISTVYEQESEMTIEQLQEYDQQLLKFYNNLPEYLKFNSGFEYGHEDLFLACIRVNIEYNATRIILHKLFVPDQNDPRPSQFSLESLNICLKTALKQLSTLNSGSFLPKGRCAFDRDELWRASQVISMSMDIYRGCASTEDRDLILKDIPQSEFENGLTRSLNILKSTMEFEALNRNWIQVADWLQVEIRRHQLYSNPHSDSPNSKETLNSNTLPDFFLANLKADAEKSRQAGMVNTNNIKTALLRRMSRSPSQDTNFVANNKSSDLSTTNTTYNNNLSWMQHQQLNDNYTMNDLPIPTTNTTNTTTTPTLSSHTLFKNSNMPMSFMDTSYRFQKDNNANKQFISKFSTIPTSSTTFVQYQPQPSFNHQSSEFKNLSTPIPKNQSKFRYFSPKKMNKYMFIDDTPMS